MNLFKYLISLFQTKHPTGLIADPRTSDEKSQDYLHEEISGDSAPIYKDGKSNLVSYPSENQMATQSCVAHGGTLAFTKGNPRLSKMFAYRNRFNYPDAGMWLQNIGDILKNLGSCLYDTLPNVSDEVTANSLGISASERNEALKNKAEKYVQIQNFRDIDTITSAVNSQPVAIIIYASLKEWSKDYPSLEDNPYPSTAQVQHCIGAVDAFIENGVKYLKIQDSAWFGGINVRYLSEEFIKQRCRGALYFTKLSTGTAPKPDHIFNVNMQLGDDTAEVTWLQKRLMFEGTFPVTQTPTGYFGGITLKAVKDYQAKHGIIQTGFVGQITRTALNS